MPITRPGSVCSTVASSFLLVSTLSMSGWALAQRQNETFVPGSASALVFNEVFNVGGVGDRTVEGFEGSNGCGGTATSGGGGQALSNVLNEALGTGDYDDNNFVGSDRSLGRNLWRFCDNLYQWGGEWSTFFISPDDERLQSAGMAPDELFGQINQAAMMTRAQVRSVGSRAKQMRLAALGFDQEAMLAGNGAVSIDVDGSSFAPERRTGLNASDEPVEGSRMSVWANIRYVDIEADTTAIAIGSQTDGLGAVVGLDFLVGSSFFGGVSLTLTELDTDFDRIMGSPTGRSETENTALQFIWSYFPNDRFYLSGVVGVSDLEFENSKYVATFDVSQPGATVFAPLDSSPDGSTEFLNLMAGLDFRRDSLTISPYVRLEYLDTEIDGFVERSREGADNTLSLTVLGQSNTSLTGTIGAQLSFPRSTQSGIWTPFVRAELVKEFEDQSDALSGFLTIVPEAQFYLAPTETDEEYAYFGVGVFGQLMNGWTVLFDLDTLAGFDALDSYQATVGLRKEF